jgi:hypothetical protein
VPNQIPTVQCIRVRFMNIWSHFLSPILTPSEFKSTRHDSLPPPSQRLRGMNGGERIPSQPNAQQLKLPMLRARSRVLLLCTWYAHLFSSTHASTSSARTVDGHVCGAPDPSKKILGTPHVALRVLPLPTRVRNQARPRLRIEEDVPSAEHRIDKEKQRQRLRA